MTEIKKIVALAEAEKKIIEDFFSEQVVEQITYVLERCISKVSIVAILDDSEDALKREISTRIDYFLQKFASITNKVDVSIYKKDENRDLEMQISSAHFPVIALFDANGLHSGVKFYGFPGGHEFEAFVLSIYNLAGPGQPLAPEFKEYIEAFNDPLDLRICVSLSCDVCPELVQAGNRFAILNSMASAAMVDLEYYPEIFEEFDIPSVPAMIINNQEVLFGRRGMRELLDALRRRKET